MNMNMEHVHAQAVAPQDGTATAGERNHHTPCTRNVNRYVAIPAPKGNHRIAVGVEVAGWLRARVAMDATMRDGAMLDVWASGNSAPSGMGNDKDAQRRSAQVSATHAHVESKWLSQDEAQSRAVPVVYRGGGSTDAAACGAGVEGSPLVLPSAPRVRALTNTAC